MKAIVMTSVGDPDVLVMDEVEKPAITEPDQILVRLKAAGINPVDTKLRSRGTYYPEQMPAILGCDGAGVVEAVGDAVSRFKVGDGVWFFHSGMGDRHGNYAEYTVLSERRAVNIPQGVDYPQAAAAPLVLITAWEALYDRAGMKQGQTVLIHAGAGGVGHVAIQLARAAGCRVLTTVGSAEKADFVKALGADVSIPYHDEDFVEAVLRHTDGKGVDIAFDTVGGKTFERTFAAVKPYGDIVSLLQPGPEIDWKIARMRNLRISLELMLSPPYYNWTEAQDHQTWILEQCAALFAAGQLCVHVAKELALSEAAEAHRLIEQGGMSGKLVLLIP